MRTARLDVLGFLLVMTSIAFSAIVAIERSASIPPDARAIESDLARTVAIAVRARAEGRPAHADSLLASIAVRGLTDADIDPASTARLMDASWSGLGGDGSMWLSGFALATGLVGAGCVVVAARRRRLVFRLISVELGQSVASDDPGAIVGGLFRLRAERFAAQRELEKALARLEASSRPESATSRILDESVVRRVGSIAPGPNPAPFHEMGRIVEITPVDSERPY